MSDTKTISADKLCAITGLTDRRHRQIAKEGYFPPPTGGEYQLTPTLVGLFRYYRESYQKTAKTLADDKQQKIRKEIELLELKIQEQNRRLVPAEEVRRVWNAVTTAIGQIITASELPQKTKVEIVESLRRIKVADYYREISDTDGDQGDSAD